MLINVQILCTFIQVINTHFITALPFFLSYPFAWFDQVIHHHYLLISPTFILLIPSLLPQLLSHCPQFISEDIQLSQVESLMYQVKAIYSWIVNSESAAFSLRPPITAFNMYSTKWKINLEMFYQLFIFSIAYHFISRHYIQ